MFRQANINNNSNNYNINKIWEQPDFYESLLMNLLPLNILSCSSRWIISTLCQKLLIGWTH